MIIAVDFDSTITNTHFPETGAVNPGCREVLTELHNKGHKIFLWTCRSGDYFMKAMDFCIVNNIPMDGFNRSTQKSFKSSNKEFANIYIDDSALGCPVNDDGIVDWKAVRDMLVAKSVL